MECLDNIKIKFKDFKIISYIDNVDNENLWKLVDLDLIDSYKNAQHTLNIKNKIIYAEEYNFKSIIVFDIDKGIDKVSDTDSLDSNNYKVLATRGRVHSNPIWRIIDPMLQDKYHETLLSIKYHGITYNAADYRLKVVAIKHIFSNEIMLIHCNSLKVALKI